MPTKLQEMQKADKVDALRKQCERCKLGMREITPRGGCEVRKKLVVDQSDVAWRLEDLFFDSHGNCKMFQEKPRKVI